MPQNYWNTLTPTTCSVHTSCHISSKYSNGSTCEKPEVQAGKRSKISLVWPWWYQRQTKVKKKLPHPRKPIDPDQTESYRLDKWDHHKAYTNNTIQEPTEKEKLPEGTGLPKRELEVLNQARSKVEEQPTILTQGDLVQANAHGATPHSLWNI